VMLWIGQLDPAAGEAECFGLVEEIPAGLG
jgi:hypothetical protein